MPRFSQQFVDRVRQANPIADVVGEHVPLRKSGKSLKACCPFHNEKTPSFMVSTDREIYKCFGCGKGGNVFSFMMDYDGVSFPEAVEILANRAGIPLESLAGDSEAAAYASRRRQQLQRLYSLCQFAQSFFEKCLASDQGSIAREYIKSRNIHDEAARAFRLGYAPQEWDALLRAARSQGFSDDEIFLAGLVVRNDEKNTLYDRFRHRLIFPIWDLSGNVIAFGGRSLDSSEPKYLNSPETPVYIKSKVLYPIHLTKRAIQQKGFALLCEGYMDAIMLAQFRFTYAVASCGTALTDDQAHLLRRFTEKVIVAYDGDNAGQDAALRSIAVLVAQNIDVYIAPLQGGDDPDSFLNNRGADAFRELLDTAIPFFPFLLDRLASTIDIRTPHGQQSLCTRVFPLLNTFESQMLREGYLEQLSRFMNVDSERTKREFGVFRSRNAPSARQTRGPSGDSPAPVKTQPAEDVFLATICRDDQALAYALNNLDLSYITHPLAHEIIEKMYRHYRNGDWHGIEMFINSVSDEEASLITTVLTSVPPVDDNALTILEDCIKSLHVHAYTIEIQQLKDELRLVSDPAGIQDIQGRIRSYQMLKRDQNKIKKLTV